MAQRALCCRRSPPTHEGASRGGGGGGLGGAYSSYSTCLHPGVRDRKASTYEWDTAHLAIWAPAGRVLITVPVRRSSHCDQLQQADWWPIFSGPLAPLAGPGGAHVPGAPQGGGPRSMGDGDWRPASVSWTPPGLALCKPNDVVRPGAAAVGPFTHTIRYIHRSRPNSDLILLRYVSHTR